MLGLTESYNDSNPRPHEYQSDAVPTELSGDPMNRASDFLFRYRLVCFWEREGANTPYIRAQGDLYKINTYQRQDKHIKRLFLEISQSHNIYYNS